VTQVDPVPPVIPKVEGSLLERGVLRGHQGLTALAADTGGGVSRRLLVNGLPAAPAAPGACASLGLPTRATRFSATTSPSHVLPGMPASFILNTAGPPFQDGDNPCRSAASDLATVARQTLSARVKTVKVTHCVESDVPGGRC